MAATAFQRLYNTFPYLLPTPPIPTPTATPVISKMISIPTPTPTPLWVYNIFYSFTKQYFLSSFPFPFHFNHLTLPNHHHHLAAYHILNKWFMKVMRYRRYKRSKVILIQKIFRGYQARQYLENEILKTLSFHSKEVDSLELLLRRGVHAHVYDSSSSHWTECVLLLNGSCEEINLSLQYKSQSTKKDETITYLLRDIAEIYRSAAVRLLSFEDETVMSWGAIPTSPLKKSKVSKGKYGFFTIVGSSSTRPSVQIAVESKLTCVALIDSLRALIDRELSVSDLQHRGRKSWLLLSLPRLYFPPFSAFDFRLASSFFSSHPRQSPISVTVTSFVSNKSIYLPRFWSSRPSLSSLFCMNNNSHALWFSTPSNPSGSHISSPINPPTNPPVTSLVSFLYYSTPSLNLSTAQHIFTLSLHHISEIRMGLDSCGFRTHTKNEANLHNPLCCVGIFTPEFCLEVEFLDQCSCDDFVRSLRCLQYLERYSKKNKAASSSLSSQSTQ